MRAPEQSKALEEALDDVEIGMSIAAAARKNGINSKRLRRAIDRKLGIKRAVLDEPPLTAYGITFTPLSTPQWCKHGNHKTKFSPCYFCESRNYARRIRNLEA